MMLEIAFDADEGMDKSRSWEKLGPKSRRGGDRRKCIP